jgi:hypothetical protein
VSDPKNKLLNLPCEEQVDSVITSYSATCSSRALDAPPPEEKSDGHMFVTILIAAGIVVAIVGAVVVLRNKVRARFALSRNTALHHYDGRLNLGIFLDHCFGTTGSQSEQQALWSLATKKKQKKTTTTTTTTQLLQPNEEHKQETTMKSS